MSKKVCKSCAWTLNEEGKCDGCGYDEDECDCDSIIYGLEY